MAGTRHRGFNTFWFGQAVSQVGDEITLFALPWLLAEATTSPLAVGLLEAVSFLPVLFFGLLVGVVADRRSRRTSMLVADAARFIVFGSIPVAVWLTDTTVLAHVLVVAFLAGAARILFEAASQSHLPDLLRGGDVVVANSRLSVTEGVAIIGGPTLAGLLVAAFGAATAVALDSLTFLASFVAIAVLTRVPERTTADSATRLDEIRAGLRSVRSEPIVASSTLINMFANVATGMTSALFVFLLQQTLGLSGLVAGLVMGANGIGVLLAGRIGRHSIGALGYGRTIVIGHAIAACGVLMIAASTAGSFAPGVAGLGLAALGLGVVMTIIASVSVRQARIPGPLLGRVTATYRTALHLAIVVGALLGGTIGEFVGVREALWCAGGVYALVVVGALFTALNRPDPAAFSTSV
jgi:MFS family permease